MNMNETPDISELSKKGYRLLRSSRPIKAMEQFREILDLEEDNAYALVGMGDALRKDGRFDEAAEYYRNCLALYPENKYALFGIGDCLRSRKDYAAAAEIWERDLELDGENLTVLTRLADAYRKIRDFNRARDTYNRTLRMDPLNSYAIIGLGHLHYDFKHFEAALEYWMKMDRPELKRVDIRVLTSIGNCYRKLKRFDEGIPYFERALKIQPENFYGLFGLGDCYRGLNMMEKSIECWERILENDPQNRLILTRVGDAYRRMGEIQQAKHYYESGLALDFDFYATLGMALIAKTEGEIDKALLGLRALMKIDPKNPRFYLEVADCYAVTGRMQEAAELLRRFIEDFGPHERIQEVLHLLEEGRIQGERQGGGED